MDPGSGAGMTEDCTEAEVLGLVLDSSRNLGMTREKGPRNGMEKGRRDGRGAAIGGGMMMGGVG